MQRCSQCNDSLDQVRRNLALCNEFEFKFKKCVSMPYITEAIPLSKNPYSPGMLQVGNLRYWQERVSLSQFAK